MTFKRSSRTTDISQVWNSSGDNLYKGHGHLAYMQINTTVDKDKTYAGYVDGVAALATFCHFLCLIVDEVGYFFLFLQ